MVEYRERIEADFNHAYALDLDPDRLEPLIADAHRVFDTLKKDVDKRMTEI